MDKCSQNNSNIFRNTKERDMNTLFFPSGTEFAFLWPFTSGGLSCENNGQQFLKWIEWILKKEFKSKEGVIIYKNVLFC